MSTPQVQALQTNLAPGQIVPLASMFTVFDPDPIDVITTYRLSEGGPNAGQFIITGPANARLTGLIQDLQNGLTIEFTAAELGSFSYQAAGFTSSETFTIAASDGDTFSLPSTNFVSTGNTPPQVNAVPSATGINTPILFEQLFTGQDIESPIESFQVRDNGQNIVNGNDVSGFFRLDGIRLAPNVFHEIDGDDLSRFVYVGGSVEGVETFTIEATDGVFDSGQSTQSIVTGNSRPTVVPVGDLRVAESERIAASDLFQISDADGDAAVRYFVADQNSTFGSGFFELNGVVQAADQVFQVEADDINTLFFVGADVGRGTDSIRVQVFDGFTFSEPETFLVVTSAPPVISPANTSVPIGTTVQASTLFNFTDADGDTPTVFFFVDRSTNADGGRFFLNGVEQTQGQFFRITADQLGGLVYQASNNSQTEQIGIQAFDSGGDLSAVTNITVGSSSPPSVSGVTGFVRPFALIDVAPLVNFSDPDGSAPTLFRIEDQFLAPNTGQFELDGNVFPQSTAFEVTSAEFQRLQYRGGSFGPFTEPIQIQGFDGEVFSPVSTFNITTVQNAEAPVVVANNINGQVGSVFDVRSLFSVSDAGGDAIESVSFIDAGTNANTGFFTIDGVQQPAGSQFTVDFDLIAAGRVQYQVASIALEERFLIGASDGTNLSQLSEGIATSIVRPTINVGNSNNVSPNDLSLNTLETTLLSDLFTVDGAEAIRFEVFDENAAFSSGRLQLDGQFLPQGVLQTLTVEEFNRVEVVGAIVDQGRQLDPILVRAENPITGFSEFVRINVNTDPGLGLSELGDGFAQTITRFRGEQPGEATIVTFSFLDGGSQFQNFNPMNISPALPSYLRTGFGDDLTEPGAEVNDTRALNANQRDAIRSAIANIESVANIDFVEQAYDPFSTDTQIVYGSYEFQGGGSSITRGPGFVLTENFGADGIQIVDDDDVPIFNFAFTPALDADGDATFTQIVNADGVPVFEPVLDAAGNPIFTQVLDATGAPATSAFPIFNPDAIPVITSFGGQPVFPAEFGTVQNPVLTPVLDENGDSLATGDLFIQQVGFLGEPALDADGNPFLIPFFPDLNQIPVLDAAGNPVLAADGTPLTTPQVDQILTPALDGRAGVGSDVFFNIDDFDPNSFTATNPGDGFFELGLSTSLAAIGGFLPNDLSIFADFDRNSLLSGDGEEGGINDVFPVFPNGIQQTTLPLYDIAVIQALYGVNEDFNTDDNQYRFNQALPQSIFDAGGSDAINFTTSNVNENIDLRQGQFSSILGVNQALRISYGTVIENARGGSGDDVITGNETPNFLFGNDGDDTFIGNGGNDVFRGGNGNDTYQWSFGDGRDLIIEQNTLVNTVAQPNLEDETVDILEVRDPTGSLNALEDDFTFRRFGDDLRIDLTFNQGPGQGTVTIRDFANEDAQVERLRLFDTQGLQITEVDLTSIFDFATTQPQRFAVTGSALINPNDPTEGIISVATPV